jgi:hypothetical protein
MPLYPRTGKQQQAQKHLTMAMTMYREMDMRFWLEQAEAELGVAKRLVWKARSDEAIRAYDMALREAR